MPRDRKERYRIMFFPPKKVDPDEWKRDYYDKLPQSEKIKVMKELYRPVYHEQFQQRFGHLLHEGSSPKAVKKEG